MLSDNKIFFLSMFSFTLSLILTKIIARILIYHKKTEEQRNLIIDNTTKKNTPSMGGLAIIISTLIASLIFLPLNNKYTIVLIGATILFGSIGLYDDYLKIFKKSRDALKPKTKLLLQSIIGIIIAFVALENTANLASTNSNNHLVEKNEVDKKWENAFLKEKKIVKEKNYSTKFLTNIPFCKKYLLDYSSIIPSLDKKYFFLIFIIIIIFIIAATSNASNLLDGMDGVAAGSASIFTIGMMILALISSNSFLSEKFNLIYLPNSNILFLYSASLFFTLLGFLWENSYPAKIFMGDTGSLFIGGIIATIMILLKQELLIPIIGIIMVVENLSVILQVIYFKYTKKKLGTGKRLFLCAPVHHHFQAKGLHENKITIRFFIIAIISLFIALFSITI